MQTICKHKKCPENSPQKMYKVKTKIDCTKPELITTGKMKFHTTGVKHAVALHAFQDISTAEILFTLYMYVM